MDIKQRVAELWPLEDIYPLVYKDIEKRDGTIEFPFNVPILNQYVFGIPRARVTIISARTSHGKSAMALGTATSLAMAGKNIIWISLEDDRKQVFERQLCLVKSIKNHDLKIGRIDKLNYEKDIEMFSKCPMFICDGFGFNMSELNELLIQAKFLNGKKADVVFFDYVQMIDHPDYEGFTKFMRDVKIWCLVNEIGFVLVSQQNRQHDGKPSNAGMKGCIHPDSIVAGKKIKEIVINKLNIKIPSYNIQTNKKENIKPSKYIHSGKKKCLKIKTKSGKEIILSVGTKLFDGKVWRQSKTFSIGEKILVDN